jgi:ATP-dependent DNA ligase
MPLAVAREPFDDRDCSLSRSGTRFRALAFIDGHRCRLVSRRDNVYKSWPYLCEELAHAVRCDSAVLDGEIVCLRSDGRSDFYSLMFRRDWTFFLAFDLLSLNGRDLRSKPLHARKRLLAGIMPRVESRIRLVEAIPERGADFFRVACEHDLEALSRSGRTARIRVARAHPG